MKNSENSILDDMLKSKNISTERKVAILFKVLAFRPGNVGYNYLREAVILSKKDGKYTKDIKKLLYPEIAQKYDTSDIEVSEAIRYLLRIFLKDDCSENILKRRIDVFGVDAIVKNKKISNKKGIISLAQYVEKIGA